MQDALMSRSTGGWLVELHWDGSRTSITVRPGHEAKVMEVEVEHQDALDAFWHPFCYLARSDRDAAVEHGRQADVEQHELPGADWDGWSVRV
jgi:hypothetical protein